MMDLRQCATLACLLEVTAPKPGNVHRSADFEGLTFHDFVASAVAIGPAMEQAHELGVGQAVLAAVKATQRTVGTNTNLGTILLLAPMAAAPISMPLREGIALVLTTLDAADSQMIYRAIREAQAGGLGRVPEMDIYNEAPKDLLDAMRAAADRDLVARQYANHYEDLLETVVPWITEGRQSGLSLTRTIIHVHVRLMARFPDSLIARKCGTSVAEQAARKAAQVLDAGPPNEPGYLRALSDLDFWLRSDHHRRNPGTTADLVAAGLFAALRDELIAPPYN